MGKLKPCPFCGCEYEKAEDDVWWAGSHAEWCPLNNQFPGQIGNLIVPDEKKCIDAWNRRAVETAEWDLTACTRCGHDLSGWADGAYEAVADGDVRYCPSCGALNKARRKENA